MKRIYTLVIICFFGSGIFGQNNGLDTREERANSNKVVDDIDTYYYNVHDNQKIVDHSIKSIKVILILYGSIEIFKYYHFNEIGNLISTTTTDSIGDTSETSSLMYNDFNKQIKRITKGSRDKSVKNYIYNDGNLLIEQNRYNNDQFQSKTVYSYLNGRIDTITVFEKKEVKVITINKYAGNFLIERKRKLLDRTQTSNYFYNKQGQIDSLNLFIEYKYPSAKQNSKSSYKFNYDSKLRIISRVNISKSSKDNTHYIYNENNELISCKTTLNGTEKSEKYSYSNGLLLEKILTDNRYGYNMTVKQTHFYFYN